MSTKLGCEDEHEGMKELEFVAKTLTDQVIINIT